VNSEWNKVLFARAPSPNYKINIEQRYHKNILKAQYFFLELLLHELKVDIITLNASLSVWSEALKFDEAYNFLHTFYSFNLKPDDRSLRHLSRMHIRAKDMKGSLKLKSKADMMNLSYDNESYGLLMKSSLQRNMITDSILLLEESVENGNCILDRHIDTLRSRCTKIGIKHPSVPPNPLEWKKQLKESRKVSVQRPSKGKNRAFLSGIY